jgi:hypothetical protein
MATSLKFLPILQDVHIFSLRLLKKSLLPVTVAQQPGESTHPIRAIGKTDSAILPLDLNTDGFRGDSLIRIVI